jgi:hypothetical protein
MTKRGVRTDGIGTFARGSAIQFKNIVTAAVGYVKQKGRLFSRPSDSIFDTAPV